MGKSKKAKECPFCGTQVNKENFSRHLLKAHGECSEEEFREKGIEKPAESVDRKRLEKDEEIRKSQKARKKGRKAATIVAVVAIVVIAAVGGVIMYQKYYPSGGGGGSTGNGGSGKLPVAVMSTSLGTIQIELDTKNAPGTAQNFVNLAKSGFFNGLIFHRVIKGFMVQGGGFYPNTASEKSCPTIPWESTGLKNIKYTISMARRSGDVNSASSQFFINTALNSFLDTPQGEENYPYVVFGKVVAGFTVVDAIENLQTGTQFGMSDYPNNPPVISSVTIQ